MSDAREPDQDITTRTRKIPGRLWQRNWVVVQLRATREVKAVAFTRRGAIKVAEREHARQVPF